MCVCLECNTVYKCIHLFIMLSMPTIMYNERDTPCDHVYEQVNVYCTYMSLLVLPKKQVFVTTIRRAKLTH